MKFNFIIVSLVMFVVVGVFLVYVGFQVYVVCGYYYMLGDDVIMMFGKVNQVMWYDFFGNIYIDVVFIYQMLCV